MYGARLLEKVEADVAARDAEPESASAAERSAGNYPKGHAKVGGLDVSIENPAGSTRSGIGHDGKPWLIRMRDHYGYVKRTVGRDGEHVDCFVVPGTPEDWDGPVFVIDQKNVSTGGFDEHKVVLGAADLAEARKVYRRNYSGAAKNGISALHEITLDQFKEWLKDGDTTIPFTSHVPMGKLLLAAVQKSNPYHEPAGSPEGGQFASGAEPGGAVDPSAFHEGGVKGKIHEMLMSGQAYTIPEMMHATGAAEKRVKFLLSRLQNPKYVASTKNALTIVREGDKYKVVGTKPAMTTAEKAALKGVTKTVEAPIGSNAIGPHSFSGDENVRGQFVQNNRVLNDLIHPADGTDASSLKDTVVTKLSGVLKDNEAFMRVATAYAARGGTPKDMVSQVSPDKLSYGLVNQIIAGWAHTSGDNDARAKAMQLAARDEFGIKDATLGHLGIKSETDEEKNWSSAARMFGLSGGEKTTGPTGVDYNKPSAEQVDDFKAAMRAFTRAEYENTQAWFKEKGITEVSVFRGMKQSQVEPSYSTLHGQPLSSFSSSYGTARGFGSRVYMATFPVSHVVGSCRTGRGCLNESEVVVIGHPIKAIRFGRDLMGHYYDKNMGKLETIGKQAFEKKGFKGTSAT
jgi:Inorganic Pyrophosphatase